MASSDKTDLLSFQFISLQTFRILQIITDYFVAIKWENSLIFSKTEVLQMSSKTLMLLI